MLGLQHLNVPHLRGRTTVGRSGENNKRDEPEQEPAKGKREAQEEDESEIVGSGNENDSDEPNHVGANKPIEEVEEHRTRWVMDRVPGDKLARS